MATRSCCGCGSAPHIPSSFEQKFPAWKNFPAGLHALLLSQDPTSLADAKLKLESCDYAVTAMSDREEARNALRHHPVEAAFHLAIVEIDPTNASESLAIVAAAVAKHLPTILLCSTENVDMMVKGIEAGASEFIEKPLTANKLKNIWQHVFRKALITGELIAPQHLHSPCEHTSSNEGDGTVVAQQQAIINEMKSSQKPDEIALFSAEDMIDEECGRQARFNQQRLDLDLDSAPSTPQLIQATRADISLDASHHSDDCACTKSEVEDDLSTDDNCSFSHIPNDGDEMDGACLFKESHCDGYDFNDLESLEAALCEDVVNDLHYQGLDFQDHLADDLVDELLCIDMHSSMLDNILGDRDMGLSSANVEDDEAEQNDEEALLLAEVAKAEAGMSSSSSSSCSMSSSSSSSSFVCDFKPMHKGSDSAHEDESCMKECVSATDDAELSSRNRNRNKKGGSKKKKMKVDWTPELHRRFVRAAEQLGVDKAIPSKILEIMGVQNLTRHNVASHLQKYRSHKKHLQRAESAAQRSAPPKAQAQQAQVIPRPAPIVPIGLHVWGHPSPDHFCWPKPWQAPDGTYWHPSRPVGIDTWGHPASGAALVYPRPVLQRLPLAPVPGAANRMIAIDKTPGLHPPKERVDAAIREVLKNPFTPLPLGLKSPSMESVMMELQKKGIKPVPINAKQAA